MERPRLAPSPAGLQIGLIAPPCVPVPPPRYGGTEAVIDQLARGLAAAGHQVRLFTTGDATCSVERHWLHPRAVGTTGTSLDELGHVQAAYAELAGCDVIHDHTLLGPLWAIADDVSAPVVVTNHAPFTRELIRHYACIAHHAAVVAISHHQAGTASGVPIARVIHHGLDLDAYPFGQGDGGYLLFLGRMHPDKGVHRAIHIARAAGRPIVIAAKMWEPAERRYFAEEVEPLLGPDATYVGQVGGAAKVALLAAAEALVNPIRWPEPFGLVMIEALATGTPVMAFAEGAAPEIVDHGRTGFLCRDEADMARRVGQVGALDRRDCRRVARERFSTDRMVRDHLALYRQILAASAVIDLRPVSGRRSGRGSTWHLAASEDPASVTRHRIRPGPAPLVSDPPDPAG